MSKKDAKSHTVWLSVRHQKMLDEMPGVQISEVTRKAIEETFEGRHDRDYGRLCIEADVRDLLDNWERMLGTKSSHSITSTEDGFRLVLTVLKEYDG